MIWVEKETPSSQLVQSCDLFDKMKMVLDSPELLSSNFVDERLKGAEGFARSWKFWRADLRL